MSQQGHMIGSNKIFQLLNMSTDVVQLCLELLSFMSQTSFGHISINSLTILTVSKAMESPQKDLLINASHVLRQSILAEILSRLTGNHYVTVYQIANISETTMINASVLGSAEAFFITLRMSLEQPQGN